MSKVFLSYSRSDSEFVDELYRRLSRDGVECFYDQESIAWGANWVRALEVEIDDCEVLLCVVTPAFVASKWTELERTSGIAPDPEGIRTKVLPLLRAVCDLPPFLRPIQSIDVTTGEKFERSYAQICSALGGSAGSDPLPHDRTRLPPVAQLPRRHRMPYRSLGRRFAGRVDDLWQLHDLLAEETAAVIEGVGVISGTGGLGKTQLATEYVHRFAGYYPGGVFWADGDQGLSSFVHQIAGGAVVEIDGTLPTEGQCEALWRSLSGSPQRTLIVLDNFPEAAPLEPWLPVAANIRTVLTTRRRDLRHSKLLLEFLDEDDGIALLNGGERVFGQEAGALVEALGGLPLALELARNFLNLRPDLGIDDLLAEMDRLGDLETLTLFAEHYRDELPTAHEKAVGATIQLSWDRASEDERQVLTLMASLAPAPVPRGLLRRALGAGQTSPLTDRVEASVAGLARLSLVELDEAHDPQVHRLIGAFVRTVMRHDKSLSGRAVKSVAEELSRSADAQDTSSLDDLEKILPHAEIVLSAGSTPTAYAVKIADSLGWHHRQWGRFQIAKGFRERTLDSAERSFGPGHPTIANRRSLLASLLRELGD